MSAFSVRVCHPLCSSDPRASLPEQQLIDALQPYAFREYTIPGDNAPLIIAAEEEICIVVETSESNPRNFGFQVWVDGKPVDLGLRFFLFSEDRPKRVFFGFVDGQVVRNFEFSKPPPALEPSAGDMPRSSSQHAGRVKVEFYNIDRTQETGRQLAKRPRAIVPASETAYNESCDGKKKGGLRLQAKAGASIAKAAPSKLIAEGVRLNSVVRTCEVQYESLFRAQLRVCGPDGKALVKVYPEPMAEPMAAPVAAPVARPAAPPSALIDRGQTVVDLTLDD